jgi:hypothetical protein
MPRILKIKALHSQKKASGDCRIATMTSRPLLAIVEELEHQCNSSLPYYYNFLNGKNSFSVLLWFFVTKI